MWMREGKVSVKALRTLQQFLGGRIGTAKEKVADGMHGLIPPIRRKIKRRRKPKSVHSLHEPLKLHESSVTAKYKRLYEDRIAYNAERFAMAIEQMNLYENQNCDDNAAEGCETPVALSRVSTELYTGPLIGVEASVSAAATELFGASEPGEVALNIRKINQLLLRHIKAKDYAIRKGVLKHLLQRRRRVAMDKDAELNALIHECLSLLGYHKTPCGRGLRILALDGGGTRGLATIEMVSALEIACKKPLWEVFDYICGVSTGALVGIMLGIYRVSTDDMIRIYEDFSQKMFKRNSIIGVGNFVVSHAYYDTAFYEEILRNNFGDHKMSETARSTDCPKVSAIATIVNQPQIANYVFRNYNLPTNSHSFYEGGSNHYVWQAIRASSAAPYYYEECKLGNLQFADGGMLCNNPSAIALHEARLLWPNETLQCVVSLGTGRYQPFEPPAPTEDQHDDHASAGGSGGGGSGREGLVNVVKNKIVRMRQSVAYTEDTHIVLHDLLPATSYFRFNPYLSQDFALDECDSDQLTLLRHDTSLYMRRNQHKVTAAASRLGHKRKLHQKVRDYFRQKFHR